MKIRIITVGHKPPEWVSQATQDYCSRLPREFEISWHECKPAPRGSGTTSEKAMSLEANTIRAALPASARLVVLDEQGEDMTSASFGKRFSRWRDAGEPIAIVIGGADGIAPELKAQAHEKIRLSSMTLPHALVRVVLAEQLFRAWSLLANHPYHRV
jgi:23S rRNA (pseudouridine1915-N3)-methyltransferase